MTNQAKIAADAVALIDEIQSALKNAMFDHVSIRKWKTEKLIAALELLKPMQERIDMLETALKPFACTCPGDCERLREAYAPQDLSCFAHDALKTKSPA